MYVCLNEYFTSSYVLSSNKNFSPLKNQIIFEIGTNK